MKWPKKYKCVPKEFVLQINEFKLVPIRYQDRYLIMKWRNEQLYHLRQESLLTKKDQDFYFENIIKKQFDETNPNQILFSFLRNNKCIGYGGLVHINWKDKISEISFVMNTSLEEKNFNTYWSLFLSLIKKVAFKILDFYKIFTFAFDLRPKLYTILENNGFDKEDHIKNYDLGNDNYCGVITHSLTNQIHSLKIRRVLPKDSSLLFSWRNEKKVRENAFNSKKIDISSHLDWFKEKISDSNTKMYILETHKGSPIGQVRFDRYNEQWEIDYSIDKNYRNLGLGKIILEKGIKKFKNASFIARVKNDNIASKRTFEILGFKKGENKNGSLIYFKEKTFNK